MELDEFIKNTLVSIYRGIHKANEEIAKSEGQILGKDATSRFVMEPHQRDNKEGYISFDVAVTVSSETKKSGGASIKIAIASLGGEASNAGMQEHVSRIKFHVMPHYYIS